MEKIRPYMPLVVVYSFSLMVALAMNLAGATWQGIQFLHYFLGLILFTQALLKILSGDAFAVQFAHQDSFAKNHPLYAQGYPLMQFVLALLFMAHVMSLTTYLLTFVFYGFSAYQLWAMLKTKRGCRAVLLGTAFTMPMTPVILVEHASIVLLTLLALITSF